MNIMAELHTKITGNDGLSTFDGLITNLLEAKLEFMNLQAHHPINPSRLYQNL